MLMDAASAFAGAVAGPDSAIDLGRAALLIAHIEHPGLPVDRYLATLDRLARASTADRAADPARRLDRLREFLFAEQGFRGNLEDYYDPRNSCLNDVLDRRLGIPITLALVVIEVGRRVGLEIDGIGLPGHFVVQARVGGDAILLDPFAEGGRLTPAACAGLVERALGRPVTLRPEHFEPVSRRQFLARVLMNLKAAYGRRRAWARALAATERLLILDPTSAAEMRDGRALRLQLASLN
jgi:regulator of sirC expression with transglutaminase-like and TPR domain